MVYFRLRLFTSCWKILKFHWKYYYYAPFKYCERFYIVRHLSYQMHVISSTRPPTLRSFFRHETAAPTFSPHLNNFSVALRNTGASIAKRCESTLWATISVCIRGSVSGGGWWRGRGVVVLRVARGRGHARCSSAPRWLSWSVTESTPSARSNCSPVGPRRLRSPTGLAVAEFE